MSDFRGAALLLLSVLLLQCCGCTSGRRDAWNPQRWESLQVSFFRRQTAAFGCYIFPPQTSPCWGKQKKLHHKLRCSSCDNFFFYWRLKGKRLTHVWFCNHRDNISFLWAPWGGQRLESFSLFPQVPWIIHPQGHLSKSKINSSRNLRSSWFVVSHPNQSHLSFGTLIHGTAVFPGAEVPSPNGSTVWIHLLVSSRLHPREE